MTIDTEAAPQSIRTIVDELGGWGESLPVREGSQVVSVRMVPSPGQYAVYTAPGVYQATRRADGVLTWRCIDSAPLGYVRGKNGLQYIAGHRTERASTRAALDLARKLGCPVVANVRHGRVAS